MTEKTCCPAIEIKRQAAQAHRILNSGNAFSNDNIIISGGDAFSIDDRIDKIQELMKG